MVRVLPCCFLVAALALCVEWDESPFVPPLRAQPAKSESGKSETPAKKTPPEKMKFPTGIIFYLDDLVGESYRINREQFDKIMARWEAIENLLKGVREQPS